MMHYTPCQLRETVGITQETYRHWRKALSPLSRVCGRGAYFTPGDLVAVAVVRVLCTDLDMRVRTLSSLAEALFKTCRTTPWPTLERGHLDLDIPGGTVDFKIDNSPAPVDGVAVSVPLRSIINRLQAHFIDIGAPDPQHTLRFPPTAVQGTDNKAKEHTCSAMEQKL